MNIFDNSPKSSANIFLQVLASHFIPLAVSLVDQKLYYMIQFLQSTKKEQNNVCCQKSGWWLPWVADRRQELKGNWMGASRYLVTLFLDLGAAYIGIFSFQGKKIIKFYFHMHFSVYAFFSSNSRWNPTVHALYTSIIKF